jgi:hypothetical protein
MTLSSNLLSSRAQLEVDQQCIFCAVPGMQLASAFLCVLQVDLASSKIYNREREKEGGKIRLPSTSVSAMCERNEN